MLNAINFSLTGKEILYAAILAFCLTWFINNALKIRSVVKAAASKDDRKVIVDIVQ